MTDVGGLPVHRSLPTRGRRTVGAWCFLDRFGPIDVTPQRTMTVGPHAHIGLHAVTWLLRGEVLHTDSLGNEQTIRPGQLNLMTAGQGIAHAEDARTQLSGSMEGVQLWVAQPEGTRHGTPSFAHHDELPLVELGGGAATVLMGEFGGIESPARTDSPLVGLDISGDRPLDLPLQPHFEYGFAVLQGDLGIGTTTSTPNELVYLGAGHDEIHLDLAPGSRILVLGGEPFDEIAMWWNFVARNQAELEAAGDDWNAGSDRFGMVNSTLPRIPAPRPFWLN